VRHRVAYRKLGRITPHRIALLRNLTVALFDKERIRTTLIKAKELRPYAERLITLAKRDGDALHARRLVRRDIQDRQAVRKLFDTLGTRFATRPGGYTRILRLGPRKGDGTEMAIVELIGSEYKPEKKAKKGEKADKPAASGKPESKAEPKAERKPERAARGKDEREGGGRPKGKGKAAKGKGRAAEGEPAE
jgi:large subunit ribosomal protein L17